MRDGRGRSGGRHKEASEEGEQQQAEEVTVHLQDSRSPPGTMIRVMQTGLDSERPPASTGRRARAARKSDGPPRSVSVDRSGPAVAAPGQGQLSADRVGRPTNPEGSEPPTSAAAKFKVTRPSTADRAATGTPDQNQNKGATRRSPGDHEALGGRPRDDSGEPLTTFTEVKVTGGT